MNIASDRVYWIGVLFLASIFILMLAFLKRRGRKTAISATAMTNGTKAFTTPFKDLTPRAVAATLPIVDPRKAASRASTTRLRSTAHGFQFLPTRS